MQLTYSSVPDDLMAFNRYVIKRSPSRKRLFVFFLAVVVCIAVVMTAVAYFSRPDTLAWAVIAVIWSMMIAFWPLLIHWTGEWAVRKCVAEGFLAEQITATFTDEGVRLTSPTIESRTRWGAVTKVVEDVGHIYLFISPTSAFIIPRRAFERQEDYEAALGFARGKLGSPT